MYFTIEFIISIISAVLALLLLIFVVDWRHFRDWVVVFLYKSLLDAFWGVIVVGGNMIKYPVRQLPEYFETSILFEWWIFPILCVLYNQVTRKRGLPAIFYFAILFSAGMTAIEYSLEKYTLLIKYINWSWFATFATLTVTFLSSRAFIAFFRWGCDYFKDK